jgi:hypothetical protein
MRTLVFTLLLAVVAGACSLVFDAKGSSSSSPPDAETADAGQHEDNDGGHRPDAQEEPTNDGGCNPEPADAAVDPADAFHPSPDAQHPGPPDAGDWSPDANW